MRRTTTAIALAAATTAAVVGVGAGTASAANTGDTVATFTVTGSTLDITVPAGDNTTPKVLGSGAAGSGTTSGVQLGSVSVTDSRGALLGQWTTTVTSTDFLNQTTGGTSPEETVTKANVNYASGLVTGSGGGGLAVYTGSGTAGAGIAAAVGTGTTAAKLVGGVGNNTASWNPTITFTLGAQQTAGTYRGTITHSVA